MLIIEFCFDSYFPFSTLEILSHCFLVSNHFSPLFLCSSFVFELPSISSVFSAWSPKVWLRCTYCDSLYVNIAWSLLSFLELLSRCFSVYRASFWLLFLQMFFSASVSFSLSFETPITHVLDHLILCQISICSSFIFYSAFLPAFPYFCAVLRLQFSLLWSENCL